MANKAFFRLHNGAVTASPETAASATEMPSFLPFSFAEAPRSLREETQRLGFPAQFFELEREPFASLPDEEFFFSNAAIRQTYRDLYTALCGRPGFALLIGESGVGKTVLVRRLCRELKASGHLVIARYRAGLDLNELIRGIAEEMKLPLGNDSGAEWLPRLREATQSCGDGLAPVLVIDDAERLGGNVMVNLPHLLAGPPQRSLRILLSGRPQLVARLDLPVFAELKEMRSGTCRLERLEDEDAASYIFHRLRRSGHRGCTVFSPAAVNAVIAQSAGLPRRINQLCARSLIAAAAVGERVVTAEMVESAATEAPPKDAAPRNAERSPLALLRQRAVIAASLCATLVVGGMAFYAVRGRDQASNVVGAASIVAESNGSRGDAAIAHRPVESASAGDASLPEDGSSSVSLLAQATPRRFEPHPASTLPAALDMARATSAQSADVCRDTRRGSAMGNCASPPGGTELGNAEQGGRADATILPATEDLREGGADVVSAERALSSAAGAESRAAAVMSRAQGQLEDGHIIAPLGDNAVESYRDMVALSPDSPEARLLLQQVRLGLQASARNALAAGNGDEAERLYALAVHPESDLDDAGTTTLSTALEPNGEYSAQLPIANASDDTSPAMSGGGASEGTTSQIPPVPVPASEGMTDQATRDQSAGDAATTQEMSKADDATRSKPSEGPEGTEAAGEIAGGAAMPETSERMSPGRATSDAAPAEEMRKAEDTTRLEPGERPEAREVAGGAEAASEAVGGVAAPDMSERVPPSAATGDIATKQEVSGSEDHARSEPEERLGGVEAAREPADGRAMPDTSARAPAGAAAGTVGQMQAEDPGGMPGSASSASIGVAAATAATAPPAGTGHVTQAAGMGNNSTPKEVGGVETAMGAAQQARVEDAAKSSDPPLEAGSAGSSVPVVVPLTPSMAPELIAALIKRGDELVKIGDISGARLAYERAAAGGSAKAMSALAMTYDASFLGRVNARGMQPDAGLAAEWYRKAAALGDAEASLHVRQLPVLAR